MRTPHELREEKTLLNGLIKGMFYGAIVSILIVALVFFVAQLLLAW